MKYISHTCFFCIAFVLLCSCNQGDKRKVNEKTSAVIPTTESIDTSRKFVKKLLNCSPKEVAKLLGKPDQPITVSKDCDYLPNCSGTTYQNEKYEVLYFKNRLKWIEVNDIDIFDKSAIQYVGFSPRDPTWANKMMIHWRSAATRGTASGPLISIDGIRQISVLPANSSRKGYIIIEVETNYNKKF